MRLRLISAVALVAICLGAVLAAEPNYWPTWRYDAQRGGSTPAALPEELHLQWSLRLPALKTAWPDQPKLVFDRCYEPIVADGRMYVGSSWDNSLRAYDVRSGKPLWTYFTHGPVRFAPTWHAGKIYAVSDDGYLYCLRANSGELAWKFRGGPDNHLGLGNDRIISLWPARGAPVIADNTVYFAASIWPFMGVFIHALHADTGKVVWTNDGDGSMYIRQPHYAYAFGGVAPQGPLVIAGDYLLVPGGRSVPACYERRTGKFVHYRLAENGKYGGAAEVTASGSVFYNGGAIFDLETGNYAGQLYDAKPPAPLAPRIDDLKLGAKPDAATELGKPELSKPEPKSPEPKSAAKTPRPDSQEAPAPPPIVGAMVSDASGLIVTTKNQYRAYATPVVERSNIKSALGLSPIVTQKVQLGVPKSTLSAPGGDGLIRAGNRLYGGSGDTLVAIDLVPSKGPSEKSQPEKTNTNQASAGGPPPRDPTEMRIAWQKKIPGKLATLLAAEDRLFVVTQEGTILCYGGEPVAKPAAHESPTVALHGSEAQRRLAESIIKQGDVREGYAVVWGLGDNGLLAELVRASNLYVIGIDPDPHRVAAAQQAFSDAQLTGRRVEILGAEGLDGLPPYLASLMVIHESDAPFMHLNSANVKRLYETLRPFGGMLVVSGGGDFRKSVSDLAEGLQNAAPPQDPAGRAGSGLVDGATGRLAPIAKPGGNAASAQRVNRIPQAVLRTSDNCLILIREGALPGSSNWTHEHFDAANTRSSTDHLVKAPLGVLWWGGASNDKILPRHGHGPQPQVVDGRIVIEGPDILRAIDIYTGRLLWERQLPGIGKLFDNTRHHPGANGIGTNYISTSDGIYALLGNSCARLDPATGKTLNTFRLPPLPGAREPRELSYINVVDDYLILGADPPETPAVVLKRLYDDYVATEQLWVLDRHKGNILWSTTAVYEYRNNAICTGGGRLYCVDLLSETERARLKRRGEEPAEKSRLHAFDLKTGKPLWSTDADVFGTWLSYSAPRDILIEAGRPGRDVLKDEPRGLRAYNAASGAALWTSKLSGPAMIQGDKVHVTEGKAVHLTNGKTIMRIDPVTLREVEWNWVRTYGCNTPQCSEHLMLFRSGAAGYYDLANDGGTGNFGGFRSSCTNNLIAAGGVLCAPDYTRTCTCSYQLQTSVALMHMPEVDQWTRFAYDTKNEVKRIGFNLGAPGHRRDDSGTLWVNDFPKSKIEFDPAGGYYSSFTGRFQRAGMPWVCASGLRGVRQIALDPLLAADRETPAVYTVRLYFADPDNNRPGQRVFDVYVQDEKMLTNFDPVRESRGDAGVVREKKGVAVASTLVIKFVPRTPASAVSPSARSMPILSGIELIQDPPVEWLPAPNSSRPGRHAR